VVFGDVGLGDGQVVLDHFEGAVAKDALEGVDVAAVPEIINGEGVAEAVDGGVFDISAFTDIGDAFVEYSALKLVSVASNKEGLVGSCS